MNLKQYITLMIISSILAWLTWFFILIYINPDDAGLGIFFLFYSSLLIALASSFSILGLIVRVWVLKQKNTATYLASKSFRQAVLFSTLIIGVLYFESKSILNWWVILLSIAILTMLEFFIISYRNKSLSS